MDVTPLQERTKYGFLNVHHYQIHNVPDWRKITELRMRVTVITRNACLHIAKDWSERNFIARYSMGE